MEIFRCNQGHLEQLDEFYDKVVYALTTGINYPLWTYKVYPCRQSIADAIDAGTQYACVDDGKVVGAFVLNDDPMHEFDLVDSWATTGKYLVIHSLATAVDSRLSGVATAMVEFCKQVAKSCGCTSLRLDVVPGNSPAKRLYEKLGFVYRGDYDLQRGYDNIPVFSTYEYIL